MRLALCGNPNVGKTTLFNRLTRSDEPVGNWHGVTVDVRTKKSGRGVYISDLPGAYSLSARTAEEEITRDNILFGDYDVIVYVAEVNNLRRNLYMFMQLAELNKNVALVVNMMDEARGKVDLNLLSKRLGVPVVGTSVKDKNQKAALIGAAEKAISKKPFAPDYVNDPAVKKAVADMRGKKVSELTEAFVALKIMERDEFIAEKAGYNQPECNACVGCSCNTDLPARLRYGYIDKILSGVVERTSVPQSTLKIDKVALGRFALPVFLLVMSAVFVITFELGKPISNLLSSLIERAQGLVLQADMSPWVSSLLADGIVGGVGAVLAFLPQVVLIFLLTALLQDSGYMSRVAFLTDGFFKKFGLNGRAAFSVVLGLGCSATAVLSTRGISGEGVRRRAALATPFCPCSARLAVFTAISAYFGLSGFAVAAMYILGLGAALVVLKVMQAFRHERCDDEFIMEMPPYRVPRAKRVLSVVWHNVLSFLSRVGSVVLGVGIIMWVLCNFSVSSGFTGGVENSIMCTLCSIIAPVFTPLGFGSWRATAALMSGVAAKETVVSVIGSLGGMTAVFDSTAASVSFMIFTSLYVPCVATLSAIAKENGVKSAMLSVAVHTLVAYLASFLYYRSALWYAADKFWLFTVWACVAAVIAVVAAVHIIKVRRTGSRRVKT
ncbi:MAG: ferrous iron transport protein B [Clostridiales bacterium]|nr:ferrous iron transport protein B [Clostridiales bacterium]